MYTILKKKRLSEKNFLMKIHAPRVCKNCKPAQFIILKVDEEGERIPLTIADFDEDEGSITIVFQVVGVSTAKLASLDEGDCVMDFVGPIGRKSEMLDLDFQDLKNKKILFVGGGIGVAPIYPQAKWLNSIGICPDAIIGARTKDLIIMEDDMRSVCKDVFVVTDDGSAGMKGLVTDAISMLYNQGKKYDLCITIGPLLMMKFVCELTKKLNLKTIASLNPIMVDGTGMCGACRVKVGEDVRFACIDGPEFDGHMIDFDSVIERAKTYKTEEGRAMLKYLEGESHHGGCGFCGGKE